MVKENLLGGIFPPLITPFNEKQELDLDALQSNIQRLNQTGLAGYVALGSNGEFVYLNDKEKVEVLKAVIEAKGPDMQVIAGTGCEGLRDTIELTNEAGTLGAQGALVVNPNFYKGGMTPRVLKNYYEEVAERSQIPILIYNVPKNTGIDMPPSLIAQLAKHPNIIGIKDSTGNLAQLGEMINKTEGEYFQVLVGTASVLSSAITLGVKGGVLALANIAPEQCVKIVEHISVEEHEEARKIQLQMLPVNTAITATYGVPGLKFAMDTLGYKGGYPRRPLLPVTEEEGEAIKGILEEGGLLKR